MLNSYSCESVIVADIAIVSNVPVKQHISFKFTFEVIYEENITNHVPHLI